MPSEEFEDNYRIKWITERSTGKKYAVLLQNRNGPCPLLAISNALLLRGNIDIHEDMSHVNEEMLIEKITEYIFRANPLLREGEEEVVANEQQNLADVITTLPRLKKGIDVNVRFNAPDAFEFTPELSCFDMCRVRLLHGWLVDPQDPYSFDSFAKLTYNQLVDLIITASSSDQYGHLENGMDSEECSNRQVIAKLAGDFLEDNPSQLTLHGFHALSSAVAENEICVFFRNNHFSTLTRRDGKLFLLVSDLGYLHEPEIVWDKFIGIHGESQFFNFDLVAYDPFRGVDRKDQDLAERLQAEENRKVLEPKPKTSKPSATTGGEASSSNQDEDEDYKLAKKLHEMEVSKSRGQATRAARQTRKPTHTTTPSTTPSSTPQPASDKSKSISSSCWQQ